MQRRRTSGLAIVFVLGVLPGCSQEAPRSASRMWHSQDDSRAGEELAKLREDTSFLDPRKEYSLAELIDIAEQHNPETRVVWERAKQQANTLGIARSQLYPLMTASVLLHDGRDRILVGSAFYRQDLAFAQPTISLLYTLLDFGNRRAQIDAAVANLLAADFGFNETHERIIFAVSGAYYQLIGAQGETEAAQATLRNSQTVQESAEQRLQNGLATLPDVLEARAATAQAEYDVETALGGERIAQGSLAQALGVSPIRKIHVVGLDGNAQAEELKEPVESAIQRALRQRPDLLSQLQVVHATEADIRRARSNYYPNFSFSGTGDYEYLWGSQLGSSPSATNQGESWLAQLSARWTVFDGHARYNELDRARSANREAKAELDAMRDQAEVEVWTAYSNTQTAIRQQTAAAALLRASEQSYEAAIAAYRYGVKSFLDVVSAQRVLAEARSAQVLARTRVLTAVADLLFRTGDLVRTTPAAGAKP